MKTVGPDKEKYFNRQSALYLTRTQLEKILSLQLLWYSNKKIWFESLQYMFQNFSIPILHLSCFYMLIIIEKVQSVYEQTLTFYWSLATNNLKSNKNVHLSLDVCQCASIFSLIYLVFNARKPVFGG